MVTRFVGGSSVQDLSNLIRYVFRSDNSGAGGSGNSGEGEDLTRFSGESVQFFPSQAARIKTIDQIAHNWKVRKTLSGELLDQGHVTKIEEGINALEKAKTALQHSLRNPKLNQATRKAIQSNIDNANNLIIRAKELLGR